MRLDSFIRVLWVLTALVPQTVLAAAAPSSFDCSKATAPVERLICSSDALSDLDGQLSAAFRQSREGLNPPARMSLLQDQRRWLQSRLTLCNVPVTGTPPAATRSQSESCLIGLYRARIAVLQESISRSRPAEANQAKPAESAPVLSNTLFAAKGNHESVVTINHFGRYSISVKSDQGTALQLVDRMAGPGPVDGSAGHADGRIDAFLDRGPYKIRLFSDPRGSGDAALMVEPTKEINPAAQALVEFRPVAAELGDHEQRSYWLDIKERRFVALEAAGRCLSDLRLWKDGDWLVDAAPIAETRDPSGGQPLAVRYLALWLEPGLYRLTAYGGIGEKWAAESTDTPFYLRYGLPSLPEAGRASHQTSPLGIDRWLVPQSATYFRLDIDKPEHAALTVTPYEVERPFATGGGRAVIEKDSRDPKAEISELSGASSGYWLVTVDYKPDGHYRLQYFDDRPQRYFNSMQRANYWLATLEAGNPEDAIDPTALLVADGSDVVAAAALEIDPAKSWRRHFNLLGPVTLFLHTDRPVDLTTVGSGADAEFQIEPFIVSRPFDYREPLPQLSGQSWSLGAGYSRCVRCEP